MLLHRPEDSSKHYLHFIITTNIISNLANIIYNGNLIDRRWFQRLWSSSGRAGGLIIGYRVYSSNYKTTTVSATKFLLFFCFGRRVTAFLWLHMMPILFFHTFTLHAKHRGREVVCQLLCCVLLSNNASRGLSWWILFKDQ